MTDMRQLLLNTKAVIEERGHTKNRIEDDHGRVCLFGARNIALQGTALPYPGEPWSAMIDDFARALGFDHGGAAVDWNNAFETTEQMVLDRLAESAERLESTEAELVPA